jgi:hypothetical protein
MNAARFIGTPLKTHVWDTSFAPGAINTIRGWSGAAPVAAEPGALVPISEVGALRGSSNWFKRKIGNYAMNPIGNTVKAAKLGSMLNLASQSGLSSVPYVGAPFRYAQHLNPIQAAKTNDDAMAAAIEGGYQNTSATAEQAKTMAAVAGGDDNTNMVTETTGRNSDGSINPMSRVKGYANNMMEWVAANPIKSAIGAYMLYNVLKPAPSYGYGAMGGYSPGAPMGGGGNVITNNPWLATAAIAGAGYAANQGYLGSGLENWFSNYFGGGGIANEAAASGVSEAELKKDKAVEQIKNQNAAMLENEKVINNEQGK